MTSSAVPPESTTSTQAPSKFLSRRGLLIGAAASLLAAPAIVRAASIMPVKSIAQIAEPKNAMSEWILWRYVRDGKTQLIRVQYEIIGATPEDLEKFEVTLAKANESAS